MKTQFECYKKCCSCIYCLERPTYNNCEKNSKDVIDLTSEQIIKCSFYIKSERRF